MLTVAGTDLFRVAPRQVMERTVADDGGGAGAAAAGNATGTLAPNTAVENQAVVLLVHAVQRFVPTALFPQLTGVDLPGMHAMAGRGAGGGLEAANAVPKWTEVFPGWHDQSAYDLTLSDGTHLAKVLIDPRLNRLINAGALQEGALVEVRAFVLSPLKVVAAEWEDRRANRGTRCGGCDGGVTTRDPARPESL